MARNNKVAELIGHSRDMLSGLVEVIACKTTDYEKTKDITIWLLKNVIKTASARAEFMISLILRLCGSEKTGKKVEKLIREKEIFDFIMIYGEDFFTLCLS